jgi:hypothetical protein
MSDPAIILAVLASGATGIIIGYILWGGRE